MSIQSALATLGITKNEYECIIKARNVADKGYTAEIKKDIKNNSLKVMEVSRKAAK